MTAAANELGARNEVQVLRDRIDQHLSELVLEREPAGLYDPIRYVLRSGGKRLRPILLLASSRIFGAEDEDALPAALAVEVFHNFSLVHDDIMDHADERRGRPAVHVKWDESTAILCGDFLLGLSYDLLARSGGSAKASTLVSRFQKMVALLCEGQALDKEFETRDDVSVYEYLHMVDCKTGALLEASLELGSMIGGAGADETSTMAEIGHNAGRAFQIKDDLLDLTADDERWGKTIGGDLNEGKKTYLLLRAIERNSGPNREWFLRIVRDGGLAVEKVGEARERMRRSGVLEEARTEVLRYSRLAVNATNRLGESPAAEVLTWLLDQMRERLH